MSKKVVFPVPEAIEAVDWKIVPSFGAAHVDLNNKVMSVPLVDDPQWSNVRAHELAHIAFSPRNLSGLPQGVSMDTMQSVEDFRVNLLATASGIDFSAGGPSHIIEGAILSCKGDPKKSLLLTLSLFPTERGKYLKIIQRNLPSGAPLDSFNKSLGVITSHMTYGTTTKVNINNPLSGEPLSFDRTLAIAKWIDSYFEEVLKEEATKYSKEVEKEEDLKEMMKGMPLESQKRVEEAIKSGQIVVGKRLKPEDYSAESAEGKKATSSSGTMTTQYPDLTTRSVSGRSVILTDEGSLFKAPWRVTSDYKIFRKSVVKKGASVLVDASGSMALSADNIKEIVKFTPAAVIAAYAGRGEAGVLRILAKNGRMTVKEEDYSFGSGNIVDLPALRWLATQPMPRFWISDGIVTGIGDQISYVVNEECHKVVNSFKIVRVTSPKILARILSGKYVNSLSREL